MAWREVSGGVRCVAVWSGAARLLAYLVGHPVPRQAISNHMLQRFRLELESEHPADRQRGVSASSLSRQPILSNFTSSAV